MTDYANMPNVKPPQFSLYGEMERLRVENIKLKAQMKKMRNCDNCKHYIDERGAPACNTDAPCTLPGLEAWEPKE